jgi:hypothetical protein
MESRARFEPARPERTEAKMTRYGLTFDPNPKELARRDAAGSHVALLWSRRKRRAAVVVDDTAVGELVELEIRERDNPLELYQHPYAYLETRGHPGRSYCPPRAAAA